MKEILPEVQVREVRSPRYKMSAEDEVALQRVRNLRWAALLEEHSELAHRPAQKELLGLQQEVTGALKPAIPDLDVRRERFREHYLTVRDRLLPHPPPPGRGVAAEGVITEPHFFVEPGVKMNPFLDPGHAITVPGLAEFWWARTSFLSSGMSGGMVRSPFPGINVDLPDDGKLHFFGHVHWEDDEPIVGSVGAISDYVVSPERLPTRDEEVFSVRPKIRVRGVASGFTGLWEWLFHRDDKVARCRLKIAHVLFKRKGLSTPEFLTSHHNHDFGFDIRNVDPVGQANTELFFIYEPLLLFTANLHQFASENTSLLLQTHVRVDMELEGDSDIWLRFEGGRGAESVSSLENSVIVDVLGVDFTPFPSLSWL